MALIILSYKLAMRIKVIAKVGTNLHFMIRKLKFSDFDYFVFVLHSTSHILVKGEMRHFCTVRLVNKIISQLKL